MDDKDATGEAKGADDVLRPDRPGGQPVTSGEVGEELDPDVEVGDGPAAGTIDDPIHPGEVQPGDMMEQAQQRGGPIDIAPERIRRGR